MTGQTILNYRILDKIGEGGMGVVYKAEDLKLIRIVALKFLSAKALADPEARARLLREAQAAGCLNHPNICQIYGLEESGGQMFIVMAYVEGRTLAHKLHAGLTLGDALDIAIQVGEGLKAAHARGIVHRDVKAANILINSYGIAQITDFGLARIKGRSRITQPGSVLGTLACMSPEQILAQDVDTRTDIWAFGTVLYEISTGRQPFQRADYAKSMQAILNEDPATPTSINPALPSDLDGILCKALAKRPEERYQHADDLVTDLRALRRGLTVEQQALTAGRARLAEAATEIIEKRTWLNRFFRGD